MAHTNTISVLGTPRLRAGVRLPSDVARLRRSSQCHHRCVHLRRRRQRQRAGLRAGPMALSEQFTIDFFLKNVLFAAKLLRDDSGRRSRYSEDSFPRQGYRRRQGIVTVLCNLEPIF